MVVPRQAIPALDPAASPGEKPADKPVEKGPRARTRRTMLDAAMRLMQGGVVPSVSEVAEAAGVSRTTAYRYFPSQTAMIQAAVDEALGPILDWHSDSEDVEQRVADLLSFAYPRMQNYEATHRAALLLALDQWSRRQAGTLGSEPPLVRGNRKALLRKALAPLRGRLGRARFEKVCHAMSLVFGIEAMVVLTDICGEAPEQARRTAVWAAHAIIRAALEEVEGGPAETASQKESKAASRLRS